jgi:hypothetical protein
LANPSVPLRVVDEKSRIIEFETLEKQCWSYLRNIKTAINYFYKHFAHNLHLEMSNIGIFYSKDVASVDLRRKADEWRKSN